MNENEATFEFDSISDAYDVERLMNTVYDTLREESRTIREGSNDSTGMMEQFQEVRAAARKPMPGRLTVRLEGMSEKSED